MHSTSTWFPRGHSSDWAHDGGIYRPVHLLITPKSFVERVDVEALPDLANGEVGKLSITAYLLEINTSLQTWAGCVFFLEFTQLHTMREGGRSTSSDAPPSIKSSTAQTAEFKVTLPKAKLRHFDHPEFLPVC